MSSKRSLSSKHSQRPAELTAAGKFLSYVLRHAPEAIGVEMDGRGWVEISDLVRGSASSEHPLTEQLIADVVNSDAKQRFAVSDDGRRIRANQGHSVAVDLGLVPVPPPAELFHGTATRFVDAILAEGLQAGERAHVHLSGDPQTAETVGRRHGTVAVFTVDSRTMADDGLVFFRSENGVWLTDHVPPRYLHRMSDRTR